ncbi:MAG: hypothetical protein DBY38_02190 [Clostridium cadaveris]|uniref:Uncharacterized protein n=1 Tax=Clostridium cadaveris TaxID=1529 RepID=A0A316MBD9_9CLOT|nr:MAG: hypothetical protein DBY38_02190 [Clostridium cadaveris]
MRNKVVKVGEKEVIIVEKRIKEFRELSSKISMSFNDILSMELDNKTTDEVFNVLVDMLEDKLTVIFPQLTIEDIDNAYISEIEELIAAFIEVNFTGAKKVMSPLMMSVLKN